MGSAEKKGTEELIRAHYEELERIGELETPVYVAKNAINPVTFSLYVSEATRSGSLWFGRECSRDGPGPLDHWTRRSGEMGDLGAARTVVSMIHCAFARDPFDPRWDCRGLGLPFFYLTQLESQGSTATGGDESTEKT